MNLNEMRENLIKSLGLDSLDEETQNMMIEKTGELLQKRIMLRVVDLLDEESQNEFEKLLGEEGGQEEKVSAFLNEKISNIDEIVNEETEKVKEEVKGDIGALQK